MRQASALLKKADQATEQVTAPTCGLPFASHASWGRRANINLSQSLSLSPHCPAPHLGKSEPSGWKQGIPAQLRIF